MRIRQKIRIVFFSMENTKNGQWAEIQFFRERECDFSLDFPTLGPSVRFGPRNKVVLRGEGYTWTPIWWSSDNSKR